MRALRFCIDSIATEYRTLAVGCLCAGLFELNYCLCQLIFLSRFVIIDLFGKIYHFHVKLCTSHMNVDVSFTTVELNFQFKDFILTETYYAAA